MQTTKVLRHVVVLAMVLIFAGCLLAILITGPIVVPTDDTIEIEFTVSQDHVRQTVDLLCGTFAPRDHGHPVNLDRTAAWIAEQLSNAGLETEIRHYDTPHGLLSNVVGLRRGTDPEGRSVVVGAHFDTVEGTPGANDNASGVAVLIQLARTLPRRQPFRNQYFVAFGGSEPPFRGTDHAGSLLLAQELQHEGVNLEFMIALESLGYYTSDRNSQRFSSKLLQWLYPDRGNFLAVVGDLRSGPWIRRIKRSILAAREPTKNVALRSVRAPRGMIGIGPTDDLSFRKIGVPAVLITDTGPMRSPHHHGTGDLPEILHYEALTKIVRGLHGVLWDPGPEAGFSPTTDAPSS